ncbi:MAG: rhomboid family intramembrane serine protease [Melioribacteraceae bacterium]|nr:rhomboid family intramembrane serine protease [Melioribacteraceae bacterium]MCO6474825.1 rhomboid family intramembrane serine protease [Melioribacteraceae bacterium]
MNKQNLNLHGFLLELKIPVIFVVLIWIIYLTGFLIDIPISIFGLKPGSLIGLTGILTSPLIHGSFDHLFSNTVPLLVLGYGLFSFYKTSSLKVFFLIYFLSGITVWFIGRPSYHIGASGVIYGMASFIFFSGIIRRDKRAIALSLLTTFLYGGLIWGILPIERGISWEGHLAGGFWGFVLSIIFRKKDKYIQYEWEEDDDNDIPPDKLEIKWD